MLPDTQLAADTTDLCAFGVPLKVIATQDVGGRDQDLCASVVVDDHESAELIVQAFTAALTGRPGMQAVTDQGTPYMAELTRAALDALGAEHAPQREGEPTDKATIERAFASLKSFARPLLEVSDRIARAVPALASAALAKAATTLLLTALLRAYQAGARAARRAGEQRAGISTEALARAAEQSRREAHAHDTSVRLLLEDIHAAYELDVPRGTFVRTHRRFPLEVLREAQRAFAAQAHRGDIKKRASYFWLLSIPCEDAGHSATAAHGLLGSEQRWKIFSLKYSGSRNPRASRRRRATLPFVASTRPSFTPQWKPATTLSRCGRRRRPTAAISGMRERTAVEHQSVRLRSKAPR
jgi:hypothetical protein